MIQSSLLETGVPDDVPVCRTPPCIQDGISGRVRLLEPVAVEIVPCSDKEDDEAAFWSDLSCPQSEAHHANSQGQFRDEGERDEGMYEKLERASMLLQLAQETKNGADAARQKLVAPEIGNGTTPKKH